LPSSFSTTLSLATGAGAAGSANILLPAGGGGILLAVLLSPAEISC
jgi:hypothetical protein